MMENVSSHATTADWITDDLHLQPPRRTVRADFPHTAHRQSLVTKHSRGVEGVPPLQVEKSVTLQSCIQTFSLPKGPTPPLAPVQKKSLKPTSNKMVHVSKRLPGISVPKIGRPSSKHHVDLFDHLREGFLISASGLLPYPVPQTRYSLLRGKDIQVSFISPLQVLVIAKGKSQKVQGGPLFPHLYNVRLLSVHSQPKVCLQLLFNPPRDARAYVSRQNHKVVGVSDQSGFGHLMRPLLFFIEGLIHFVQVDIGQQGRDHSSLRCTLVHLLSASLVALFYHNALKPHPDQLQHRLIRNPSLYSLHQSILGNDIKVVRQVRIIHLPPSFFQIPSNLLHRSLRSSPRAKSMRAIHEICLEDRFKYQQHRHLDHPVSDTGYSQGAHLAIGLGDVDPAHRLRSVSLGPQFSLQLIEKCLDSSLSFLNTLQGHSIDSRCSLVCPYPLPRRFQYISTENAVIQGIEPILTFSLRLATQFPSQKRDLLRHPWLRLEPFCLPFRNGALLAQAASPPLDRNMTEVWPLGSILFPELLRYYGPLRLPTVAVLEVMDSLKTLTTSRVATSSGLPGPSTDLSARALLNHPGRPRKCLRSLLPCGWQASSSLEVWPPPSQRNEAESGSLSLGLTPSLSGKVSFPLPRSMRPAYSPCSVTLGRRPQLHVERAITMHDTFHSYRSARFILAYQRRGRQYVT